MNIASLTLKVKRLNHVSLWFPAILILALAFTLPQTVYADDGSSDPNAPQATQSGDGSEDSSQGETVGSGENTNGDSVNATKTEANDLIVVVPDNVNSGVADSQSTITADSGVENQPSDSSQVAQSDDSSSVSSSQDGAPSANDDPTTSVGNTINTTISNADCAAPQDATQEAVDCISANEDGSTDNPTTDVQSADTSDSSEPADATSTSESNSAEQDIEADTVDLETISADSDNGVQSNGETLGTSDSSSDSPSTETNDDSLSASASEADQAQALPDPQFCPTGTAPGDSGCTTSQHTGPTAIADALADATSEGVIYLEDGFTFIEEVYIADYAYNLTISGGWDFSTNTQGTTSTLDAPIHITNTTGAITLNNLIFGPDAVISVFNSPTVTINGTDAADTIQVAVLGNDPVGVAVNGGGDDSVTVSGDSAANDFRLTYMDVDAVNIQMGGGDDNIVVAGQAHSGTTNIAGQAGDDMLTVDFGSGNPIPAGELNFDGGDGYDSMVFEGGAFENVSYAAIDAHSGTIDFDGALVRYGNIEPIDDFTPATNLTISGSILTGNTFSIQNGGLNGGNPTIVVSGNGLFFEDVRFANKENVTINGGPWDDTFNINLSDKSNGLKFLSISGGWGKDSATVTNAVLPGVNFSIEAETITVAANAMVSTRTLATGGTNYLNGTSTGNSGNLTFSGEVITVNSGAKLLTHVEIGSTYTGGDIQLNASDTDLTGMPLLDFLLEELILPVINTVGISVNRASITIDGATLYGKGITVTSQAEYTPPASLNSRVYDQYSVGDIIQTIGGPFLGDFTIPAGVAVSWASAKVTVKGASQISAAGDLTISAKAKADASNEVLNKMFSLGVSVATAEAITSIEGTTTLNVAGKVTINSDTETKTELVTRTSTDGQNNDYAASLAITVNTLTSHVTVAQNVNITSAKNVSVEAKGKNTAVGKAAFNVFKYVENGTIKEATAGLTVAVVVSNSDVLAKVDGTITAAGFDVDSFALNSIDGDTNTIYLPGHGLATGDVVKYDANGGTSIGGLLDGGVYYVIKMDGDHFMLAEGMPIDLDNQNVNSGAQHTLAPVLLKDFDSSDVNFDTDTVSLTAHGFVDDQKITYYAYDAVIDGLVHGDDYYVINSTPGTFQVAETLGGAAVDFLAGDGTITNHTFVYTGNQEAFTASTAVNSENNTITINDHGFQTGDVVLYNTDPTKAGSALQDEYKSFDPGISDGDHSIDLAEDKIALVDHGLETGDTVIYNANSCTTCGGANLVASPVGGLTDGITYYVIKLDDDYVQLAATLADAQAGLAIDLLPGATGDYHTLLFKRSVTVDDIPISGLRNGDRYYVTVVDANTIMLSETAQEAALAGPIDLDPTVATGSNQVLKSFSESTSGISIKATLETKEISSASAGIGGDPCWGQFLQRKEMQMGLLMDKLKGLREKLTGPSAAQTPSSAGADPGQWAAAAAVAFTYASHTVLAEVGPTAVLISDRDISIKASQKDKLQGSAEASLGRENPAKFVLSAAVVVGLYKNDVQAHIANGAHVDAGRNLTVDAALTYPFFITSFWDYLGFKIDPTDGFTWDEVSNSTVVSGLGGLLDKKLGIQGKLFNTWARSMAKGGKNTPDVSAGASAVWLDITSIAKAIIGDGVQINQIAARQNNNQKVSVTANTVIQLVNMAGIFDVNISEQGLQKLWAAKDGWGRVQSVFNLWGVKGKSGGVGVALFVMFLKTDTYATVGRNTSIHTGAAGGLIVKAETTMYSFVLAQSGAESSTGWAGCGTFSWSDLDTNTYAQILAGANITGGPVSLTANDNTLNINLAGSVVSGKSIGIGVTVSVNVVDRHTQASIGEEGGSNMNLSNIAGDVTLNAYADGTLYAFSLASTKVADTLPSYSQDSLDGVSLPALFGDQQPAKEESKFGIGIAGDGSWNIVTDTTLAFINSGGTIQTAAGKKVTLTATQTPDIIAASGAGAISTKTNPKYSAGIAGSFSKNDLTLTNKAFIQGATIITDAVTLDAHTWDTIVAISGGGSGTKSPNAFDLAAAVSWNTITTTTLAYLENVGLTLTDDLKVSATDTNTIVAINIAVTWATPTPPPEGGGGPTQTIDVGTSVARNIIDSTVAAYLSTSVAVVNAVNGIIQVLATNSSFIQSDTIAAAIVAELGAQNNGEAYEWSVGGAVAINSISGSTRAYISNSILNCLGDALTVWARNTSTIVAVVAGVTGSISSGAGSGTAVSIGVAVALNFVGWTASLSEQPVATEAYIKDSSVVARSILVHAEAGETITAVVAEASVAIAKKEKGGSEWSVGGSGGVNYVSSQVKAYIDGSGTSSDGVEIWGSGTSIQIKAEDTSTITAVLAAVSVAAKLTGTGASSIDVAIGAALAFNQITSKVESFIQNAARVIAQAGSVDIQAISNQMITAVAVAVSVSASTSQMDSSITFGGGGAYARNVILGWTNAYVFSTTLTARENLNLHSTNTSTVNANVAAVAGSVIFGGQSGAAVSIGGAWAQNRIGYTDADEEQALDVLAYIDNSLLTITDVLTIKAESIMHIYAGVGAGSLAVAKASTTSITFSVGLALAENKIRTNVKSYIQGGAGKNVSVGSIDMDASDASTIKAITVGASVAASFAPTTTVAVSIGAADARNTIQNDVEAYIKDVSSLMTTAGDVDLLAQSTATIQTAAIGVSISAAIGNLGIALSGAGAGSYNEIHGSVEAYVENSTLASYTPSATNQVSIKAMDNSTITAVAGELAIAVAIGATPIGVAIGAAIANNDINSREVTAYIAGSTVDGSAVTVSANVTSSIEAWAMGGEISTLVSAGGSWTTNSVAYSIEAHVSGGSAITSTTGVIKVEAIDNSSIWALAGNISGAGAAAIGAAVVTNNISDTVKAYIDTSVVKGGTVTVRASETSTIMATAVGGQGAGAFALGGSVCVNNVTNTIEAHVSGGSTITSTTGVIKVEAIDNSSIWALAGNITIASGAVGAAVVTNNISDTVKAYIDNAVVSGDTIAVSANETSSITATAVGGEGALLFAAGGSVATNNIANEVSAYISNCNNNQVTATSQVNVTAADNPSIWVLAGRVDIGIGATVALGAAVAVNNINDTVEAYIENSTVQKPAASTSTMTVTIRATMENADIESWTAAGSLATGFAGAGSVSTNTLGCTIKAYISAQSYVSADQVIVRATDYSDTDSSVHSHIQARTGSIAASLGVAIGAAVSTNDIGNIIEAFISNSTIQSGGVTIHAGQAFSVDDFTVGGDLAQFFAGGGSVSTNKFHSTIRAYVEDDGNSAIHALGDIHITAQDDGTISAWAGSVSGSLVSAGAAWAHNEIRDTIEAYVNGYNVVQGNNIEVKADANPGITSTAIGGAGAAFFALGGSISENAIGNTVNAYINNSNIETNGDLSVTAESTPDATAWAGGGGAAIVGVGASKADADFNNTVKAWVSDSDTVINAGNDFTLTVNTVDTVTSDAYSGALGVLGTAWATSTVDIDDQADATVGDGIHITAANELSITTGKSTTVTSKARVDAGGVAAGADAQAYISIPTSDTSSSHNTNTVNINTNSHLQAKDIILLANVTNLDTNADASSTSGGGAADSSTYAENKTASDAAVNIISGASLVGFNSIQIRAVQNPVSTDDTIWAYSSAHANNLNAFGSVSANARTNLTSNTLINAALNSLVSTHELLVEVQIPSGILFNSFATRQGSFGINGGSCNRYGDLILNRSISFQSTVTLLGDNLLLVIEADGTVVNPNNIPVTETPTSFIVGDIGNSSGSAATANFVVGTSVYDPVADGTYSPVSQGVYDAYKTDLTSDGYNAWYGTFNFKVTNTLGISPVFSGMTTLNSVTLINKSNKNLVVNNIQVANGSTNWAPSVSGQDFTFDYTINNTSYVWPWPGLPDGCWETYPANVVWVRPSLCACRIVNTNMSSTVPGTFSVTSKTGPTHILIQNTDDPLSPQDPTDIILQGQIDNPLGSTEISTDAGNILLRETARITSDQVNIAVWDDNSFITGGTIILLGTITSPIAAVTGGVGNNIITIAQIPAGTNMIVDAGAGNDTIVLGGLFDNPVWAGTAALFGGDGDDQFIYYRDVISHVMVDGGRGFDQLIFHLLRPEVNLVVQGPGTVDGLQGYARGIPLDKFDNINLIVYFGWHEPKEKRVVVVGIPVILVESDQIVGIRIYLLGVILRLPNGDQVYFAPGVGISASLARLLELELPNNLPNGLKVASIMRMKVWYEAGHIQRHWALMKVSFVIPADLQNFEFAILFWDKTANGGAGDWVEVTSFRVQDSLNGVQIERQEAWVSQTGIYILVIRSSH